jgi:uncharacterized YigZ family protein
MEKASDTYYTISGKSQGIYKEKGSKFIALAYYVISEEQVKEVLQDLRREYYDARHHCFAYIIGFKSENWRANDDGEPSSTAGKPILGQITSRDLTNTLVVVIRYFGGTKLGVSGLINAYKAAASDALDNAEIILRTINDIIQVSFDYIVMNDIMKMIKDEDLQIVNQKFDSTCSITFGVRQGKTNLVMDRIDKIDSAIANHIRTE